MKGGHALSFLMSRTAGDGYVGNYVWRV
jgi:hypothetical protein